MHGCDNPRFLDRVLIEARGITQCVKSVFGKGSPAPEAAARCVLGRGHVARRRCGNAASANVCQHSQQSGPALQAFWANPWALASSCACNARIAKTLSSKGEARDPLQLGNRLVEPLLAIGPHALR